MKTLIPVIFAAIAAIGNAMFALGQRKSAGVQNGVLFVGACAFLAAVLALLAAPFLGPFDLANTLKGHGKSLLLSGAGLFLTYLGFNLLYSRYGVTQYALYAVLSIITTTILVGMLWLKEPVNGYHLAAIALAIAAIGLFAVGQSKA